MDVYIRRNLDLQFEFTMQNPEAIKELVPELNSEQKAEMEAAENRRRELEEKIWQYVEANPMKDLSGNLITRDTHEIGYDWAEGEDELQVGKVSKVWIRPKKSEYALPI